MSAAAFALVVALATPAAPAAAPPPPQVVCEFADDRVVEASGLVVDADGFAVVGDSGNPSTIHRVAPVDGECEIVDEVDVPDDGRDVEDLARAADGTWWIADTGDNRRVRDGVAILRVAPDGTQTTVPLAYDDGAHDVETLLLPADGRPVLVTKELGGRSGVYTTAAPLPAGEPDEPVTLRRVGEVRLPPSITPNGGAAALAAFGGGLLTGGAVSPDGRVAALRTYTDAWLYPVDDPGTADGLVAALRGDPVQVPLPGEPQGEAVAFGPDGTLWSASESPDEVGPAAVTERGALRSVPDAVSLVGAPGAATPAPGSPPPGPLPAEAAGADGSGPGGLGTGAAVAVALAVMGVTGGGGAVAARWWSRRP